MSAFTDKHYSSVISVEGISLDVWWLAIKGTMESIVTAKADDTVSGTWTFSGTATLSSVDANGDILHDSLGNVLYSQTTSFSCSGTLTGTISSYTFQGESADGTTTVDGTGALTNDVNTLSVIFSVPDQDSISGTGSGAANVADSGTAGNDTTTGGSGADELDGGLGDDTLNGGGGADVLNGGEGNDQLDGGTGDDSMEGGIGDDVLAGGEGNDTIAGGEGNDELTGGDGNDYLDGGDGNDIAVLSGSISDYSIYVKKPATNALMFLSFTGLQPGDIVVLTNKDGRVTQLVDIEKVEFGDGSSLVDVSKSALLVNAGTYADDKLTGATGNDTINGAAGNDVLNGATGNDKLYGGEGNDQITGGDGDDALYGDAGVDKLTGGKGNDIYYLTDTNKGKTDTITEKSGEGTDTVVSSLSSYTLGSTLENLTLNGNGNYSGYGNTVGNVLVGNGGANILAGKAGNDTLTGGLGNDHFVFDVALSATKNADEITDFTSGKDVLELSKKVFSAYKTTGALEEDDKDDFFTFDSSAGDSIEDATFDTTVHFVYDTSTGDLYYDKDGSGKAAAVLFVTLTGAPTLAETDLVIV